MIFTLLMLPAAWLVNLMPTVPTPSATIGTSQFAGYSLENVGNVTYIQANWTVVSVTKHPVLQWIGVQGIQGRLVQVGTISSPNGYQVFYERWPNENMINRFNVSVGDRLKASITKEANQSWTLYLKDISSNKTLNLTVQYDIGKAEPTWLFEAYHPDMQGDPYPLGNFKDGGFGNIGTTINGKPYNLCNGYLEQDSINTTVSLIESCTQFTINNMEGD